LTTGEPRRPVRAVSTANARAAASSGSRARYSVERPAAATSTSLATRVGNETASSAPVKPPIELPITTGLSTSSASQTASTACANPRIEISPAGSSDWPKPGRSTATQRCEPMNAGMFSSQFCQMPPRPWIQSSGGASPPVSTTLTCRPSTSTRRVMDGQSTSIHVLSSPSAYVESAPGRKTPLRALARAS
jgi:hypothetical protein